MSSQANAGTAEDRSASSTPKQRHFLRVENFDEMQNPRRPYQPTWIKAFVRDLDDQTYLSMTFAVRGFLSGFEKIAASMGNRVPDDAVYIGGKLRANPSVVGRSLRACMKLGLISRFAEDMIVSKNNDINHRCVTSR